MPALCNFSLGQCPGRKQDMDWHHDVRRGIEAKGDEQEPPGQIVAVTLLQWPRLADVDDGRWDENTRFIAHVREDVPRLIAEIRRLRDLLSEKRS